MENNKTKIMPTEYYLFGILHKLRVKHELFKCNQMYYYYYYYLFILRNIN